MNLNLQMRTVLFGGVLGLLSSPLMADNVIADDSIVIGSLCVGFDCVNGESFGFDTIRLKENNVRMKFEDTSSSSTFPSNDWQITVNDSANGGANKFSIDDVDSGNTPFTITAEAPTNTLYLDPTGRIGFGTATPLTRLHVVHGNSPSLRLEQDGSSGFTSQVWDMGSNEANFFIRDVTNGSRLPFRIVPGASNNSLYIAADGDVGFGTNTPDGQIDVAHSNNPNNHAFLITPNSSVGINIDNSFSPSGLFDVQSTGGVSNFTVASNGNVGIGSPTITSSSGAERILEIKGPSSSLTLDYGSGTNGYGELTFERDNTGIWSAGVYADNYFYIYSYPDAKSYFAILPGTGNIGLGGKTNPSATEAIAHQNGAVLTSAGEWQNSSSRSLKHDIKPLTTENARSAFMALEPVTYSYNATPTEQTVGFVAEDVPDLVATASRKTLSSIDIVAVMAKVVQQQEIAIDQLKQSIKELQLKQQNFEVSL